MTNKKAASRPEAASSLVLCSLMENKSKEA
jgi:hypothetical protein